jgi:kynureninase
LTDFAATRAKFNLPRGIVYLDGNSLGPPLKGVAERVRRTIDSEWGGMLIRGWNDAGWMDLPDRIGERIGRLIGAPAGSVAVGDTLSIKIHQALAAALSLRPERRVVLSDTGNFPSDLYMAQSLTETLGKGHVLKLVEPDELATAIDDSVAVLMLTEVDYRTGRLHDMARLTELAHAAGALTIWDLAHSAGAITVDVESAGADFAAGCTYKYLNGGPGAPAFIYVRPGLQAQVRPALAGWLGHDAPFAFEQHYRPAAGVARMRVGTPPILQMAALDASLDLWDRVGVADVRARSIDLSEFFIAEVSRRIPDLKLASPRDPARRGSHLSYRHEDGHAVMQALIARGIIGDFRAPDIMRFGFAPLYNDEADVMTAVTALQDILGTRSWDNPEFRKREAVT